MKHHFPGDTVGKRGLERFVGEDVFLREVNVPGRIIKKTILVPGRGFEIPDVTDDENQRENDKDPHEWLILPQS